MARRRGRIGMAKYVGLLTCRKSSNCRVRRKCILYMRLCWRVMMTCRRLSADKCFLFYEQGNSFRIFGNTFYQNSTTKVVNSYQMTWTRRQVVGDLLWIRFGLWILPYWISYEMALSYQRSLWRMRYRIGSGLSCGVCFYAYIFKIFWVSISIFFIDLLLASL